jgi:hypothetical protein
MNVANINVVSRGFEIQSVEGETLAFDECILEANRILHEIVDAAKVVRVPDGAVCIKKEYIEGEHFWARLWKESA